MKPFGVLTLSFACLALSSSWLLGSGGFSKPEPLITPQPRLNDELMAKPCSAYAQLQVNEYGFVTEATIVQSTEPLMNEPLLKALRRWKFKPATEAGQPVSCFILQPVRVGGGLIFTQSETKEDRDPSVRQSVQPQVPRELSTLDGYVTARVDVSAEGTVTRAEISDSTHSELEPIVLQAVAKWTFTPAVRSGKNAPSRVAIPFVFKPDPKSVPRDVKKVEEIRTDSGPVAIRRVSPEVPGSIAGQEAAAELEFVVDAFGNVVNAVLVSSSHDAFASAAIEAITRWRFKPAIQNGQPVAVKVRQGFAMHQQVLTDSRGAVDSLAKVRTTVTPEVPNALRGVTGQVEVAITIDENGNVTDAQVHKASYEEFSAPALAAARQWKFAAALKDGKPIASSAVLPFQFGQ